MPKIMNEDEFMRKALPAMQDDTPLQVEIRVSDAWFLTSAVQLATRHPDMSRAQKKRMTQIARQFEKAIAQRHPEAEEVLLMGWDERYDVDKDQT
jgi:hypothetical protein